MVFFMSRGCARSMRPSITARVSPAEKAWFASLADAAGMSESAFALRAIRAVLDPDGDWHDSGAVMTHREPAKDRITVRLRPGDGTVIAQRAAQRGMKSSTYVAALVRSHVAANPPLTHAELAALKQGIVVLFGLGRLLARTARSPALAGPESEDLRQNLSRTRGVVAALEQCTHDLARAALISWETSSG
jgi:uncharacterized protein (DUF1778 family)